MEEIKSEQPSLKLDEIAEEPQNTITYEKPHKDLVFKSDNNADVLRMRIRETTFPLSDAHRKDLERLETVFADMVNDKIAAGLAANQVSAAVRAICVKLGGRNVTMINPRIVAKSGKQTIGESCLSIPCVLVGVDRPRTCTVEWYDADGEKRREQIRRPKWTSLVCHEIEHLEGILIDTYIKGDHSNVRMYIPDWLKIAPGFENNN